MQGNWILWLLLFFTVKMFKEKNIPFYVCIDTQTYV